MSRRANSSYSTAGIIIIGDEILKGQTQDTNSHYLCKNLHSHGIRVNKIITIGDELDVIAKTVKEFSEWYTFVFTCGGIGPTHDDKTFEGVANAFDDKIQAHPELVELCTKYFKVSDLSSPKMKMAFIPDSAKLNWGKDDRTGEQTIYPLISVRNVFIFPGVPSIMEKAFKLLQHLFHDPEHLFYSRSIYINQDEISVVSTINEGVRQFGDRVSIGSYPEFHNSYYKVHLTMESSRQEEVIKAFEFFSNRLPQGSIVDYDADAVTNAMEVVPKLLKNTQLPLGFHAKLRHAVSVLEDALQQYSLTEICVGFNGGKDCTAILHLFYSVVKRKFPDQDVKIKVLYIKSKQQFPEVELFIQDAVQRYSLDLISYHGRIKCSMGQLKSDHPKVQAVVMGSRRSDPHCNKLNSFSRTDPDWPQFMRVNPVLDWSYSDIWTFLRTLSIPYCSLYDRGYTSLGSLENTHPNPLLKVTDNKGVVKYQPAYTLQKGESERDGRNS